MWNSLNSSVLKDRFQFLCRKELQLDHHSGHEPVPGRHLPEGHQGDSGRTARATQQDEWVFLSSFISRARRILAYRRWQFQGSRTACVPRINIFGGVLSWVLSVRMFLFITKLICSCTPVVHFTLGVFCACLFALFLVAVDLFFFVHFVQFFLKFLWFLLELFLHFKSSALGPLQLQHLCSWSCTKHTMFQSHWWSRQICKIPYNCNFQTT